MNLSEIGEFGLIARLKNHLTVRDGVQIGIGDDAAVLDALKCPIITMDALVEGVHYKRGWAKPHALGRKAMSVNLSDLAASGARPVAAFVSIALGQGDIVECIEEMYAGFEELAEQFQFTVAGGDTVKSKGDTMLSIALIGDVMNEKRGPVLRSGAQPGDVLLVSGTLGDSAAGLALLFDGTTPISTTAYMELLGRHHDPTPRLELMGAILEMAPEALHAALDISDGIVGDAGHMARASKVGIEINADHLPITPACQEAAIALKTDAVEWALTGGEDYELLLAVAPEWVEELKTKLEGVVGLTEIGRCVDGEPLVRVHHSGVARGKSRAWTHF